MDFAIGNRTDVFIRLEIAGDMLGIGKSKQISNFCDRQVRLRQQPRNMVGAYPADFFQDGPSELFSEPLLQGAP